MESEPSFFYLTSHLKAFPCQSLSATSSTAHKRRDWLDGKHMLPVLLQSPLITLDQGLARTPGLMSDDCCNELSTLESDTNTIVRSGTQQSQSSQACACICLFKMCVQAGNDATQRTSPHESMHSVFHWWSGTNSSRLSTGVTLSR